MQNLTVKVTNYKQGIIKQDVILENVKFEFEGNKNEISINDCLFIHVFDKLPYMRNISCNKQWFETNIYSYE